MRQSNVFFIVAVLVFVWFADETFTIGEICATSCTPQGTYNWAIVAIVPLFIVLLGFSQRRNENKMQAKASIGGATEKKESKKEQQEGPTGSRS